MSKTSKPAPGMELAVYSKTGGLQFMKKFPNLEFVPTPLDDFEKPDRGLMYSACGRIACACNQTTIKIMSCFGERAGEVIQTITIDSISSFTVSPKGGYVATFTRRLKGETGPSLRIFKVADGEQIGQFNYNNYQDSWECMQWEPSEKFLCLRTNNGISVFDAASPRKILWKVTVKDIKKFSVHEDCNGPCFAVMIKGGANCMALGKMFSSASSKISNPICQRSLFQCERVKFVWSSDGSECLVHTATDLKDGSYYGDQKLFHMAPGAGCVVYIDKDGPVHDVAWIPNTRQFIVAYGLSPSKAVIYDAKKMEPVYSFGTGAYNTIRIAPQGRFAMIGGFGNMNGNVVIFDLKERRKVSSFNAKYSVESTWMPDGRHFLTASLSPRMNVDNKICIFKYNGLIVYEKYIDELLGVRVRPIEAKKFPDRPASPKPKGSALKEALKEEGVKKAASATTDRKAYVPPHMRGKDAPASTIVKEKQEKHGEIKKPGVIGMAQEKKPNKKRRKRKSNNNAAVEEEEEEEVTVELTAEEITDQKKKELRKLEKKIKAIAVIKEKKKNGQELNEDQIAKMNEEEEALARIAELKI